MAASAGAADRVALVVGNGAYERATDVLPNPANDARAMAARLRDLEFEVVEAVDQDYRGMRLALRDFDRALQGAELGLFYYAGHGMEYRGRNFLFPTDAVLQTEGDVGIALIDMAQILAIMESTVPTRLVFLDACRNNPLARRFQRSLGATRSANVGAGLAPIDAAVGTLIAYATAPGQLAEDGTGAHSPFTAAMLQHLDRPGLEIAQLMREVRTTVLDMTQGRQLPWDSSSLRGAPIVLNLTIHEDTPLGSAGDTTAHAEIVFWESIRDSERAATYEAYLARFGDAGLFSALARDRLDQLRGDEPNDIRRKTSPSGEKPLRSFADLPVAGLLAGDPQWVRKFLVLLRETVESTATSDAYLEQLAAAERGEAWPLSEIGWGLFEGEEIVASAAGAVRSFALGAHRGEAGSQAALGWMLHDGIAVDVDLPASARLYQAAADQGLAEGIYGVGLHLENGTGGFARDIAGALEHYEKSAAGGYHWAMIRLADMYRYGDRIEQDLAAAKRYYEMVTLGDTPDWAFKARQRAQAGIDAIDAAWRDADHSP